MCKRRAAWLLLLGCLAIQAPARAEDAKVGPKPNAVDLQKQIILLNAELRVVLQQRDQAVSALQNLQAQDLAERELIAQAKNAKTN